jgi:hypothetical protein
MMSPEEQLAKVEKSQSRMQIALIVLSVVLMATLVVTWKALTAMREANALKSEQLVLQKPESVPQVAPTHKSTPRARVKSSTSTDTHASASGKEQTAERAAATPSVAGTSIASARPIERQGRQ